MPQATHSRLSSLDAFRGFFMMVLVSGTYHNFNQGFGLRDIALQMPDGGFWQFLGYEFSHVKWTGCTFWDLVMPAFLLAAGSAISFSYSKRRTFGQSESAIALHVALRASILLFLGSIGFLLFGNLLLGKWPQKINPEFSGILSQIGLAYPLAFLAVGRSMGQQFVVAIGILVAWWTAFVTYPIPMGVGNDHLIDVGENFGQLPGLFAHWNKNANLAADFDRWFLNLMPRSDPFQFNKNGLTTLNCVPTVATMIFGVMLGEFLRGGVPRPIQCRVLLVAGALGVLVGAILGATVCPIVKALWTPSWVFFSTGWVVLLMAFFVWVIEVKGYQRLFFPFMVVGMNALVAYLAANLLDYWIYKVWEKVLFAESLFHSLYGPFWESLAIMLTLWSFCFALYRFGIIVRL